MWVATLILLGLYEQPLGLNVLSAFHGMPAIWDVRYWEVLLYNNTFREIHFVGINHNKLCYSLKRLIF